MADAHQRIVLAPTAVPTRERLLSKIDRDRCVSGVPMPLWKW